MRVILILFRFSFSFLVSRPGYFGLTLAVALALALALAIRCQMPNAAFLGRLPQLLEPQSPRPARLRLWSPLSLLPTPPGSCLPKTRLVQRDLTIFQQDNTAGTRWEDSEPWEDNFPWSTPWRRGLGIYFSNLSSSLCPSLCRAVCRSVLPLRVERLAMRSPGWKANAYFGENEEQSVCGATTRPVGHEEVKISSHALKVQRDRNR